MKGLKLVCLLVICLSAALVYATEIGPGPVSGDWYATGNPYNVNGEITVHADSTLNIHEGVEVIFQGYYKFIINGILEANGVEGDSILFTAADTSVGWHSLRFIDAMDTSHLSYCIVQYGIAVGSTTGDSCGGGVYCHSSNVYISNCQITNNTGYLAGGGVFADTSSNITLSNCEISSNSTFADLTSGGGLCFFDGCNVNMTQCTVMYNHTSYGTGMGGGARITVGCNAIITDCEIAFNTTSQGGGVDIYQSDVTLIGCDIHDNSAGTPGAGGLCAVSFDSITNINMSNCNVIGNHSTVHAGGIWFAGYQTGEVIGSMQNCVVAGNHADQHNGGIYNQYCDRLTIDQCTISGNSSASSGAELTVSDANPTISNTIVEGSSGNSSIYFYNASNTSISYCDVYNSVGSNFGGSVPTGLGVITGVNANGDPCDDFSNIFLDPLFYATSGDSSFYLTEDSPCIDAGNPSSPLDPDCTIADIGCHYFNQGTPWVGDHPKLLQPDEFQLYPNYPNPFNASTILRYSLPQLSEVTLTIHNILGQRVAMLFDGTQKAGHHTITWDASDVASGIYFACLKTDYETNTIKMILMK